VESGLRGELLLGEPVGFAELAHDTPDARRKIGHARSLAVTATVGLQTMVCKSWPMKDACDT
jgi:hypothetical protein